MDRVKNAEADQKARATNRKPHLFDRLCQPRELERAWQDVLAHYSKDKIPEELRAYDRQRRREIQRLSVSLRQGTFVPEPASLIFIPKPNHPGERRPITLTGTDDRIVLTALNRLLNPLFDRLFLPHSYAYRPGGGARGAIARVTRLLGQGLTRSASGDIDDFFSNIDRAALLRQVSRMVYERPIVELLEMYLHIGAAREYEWTDTGRGVAQGSPLSPLLSNLALSDFDRFVDSLAPEWVRYADNFVLLAQNAQIVQDAFERAEAFLLEHCGLRLNTGSRRFASENDGFEFLGFWFKDGRRTMLPAKLDQKKLRIAAILRLHSSDLRGMVAEMSESAKGWRVYYGLSPDTTDQLVMLERHIAALLVPWLEKFRTQGAGKAMGAVDLKSALSVLELPVTTEPRQKLKWIELVLARSRPKKEVALPGVSAVARKAIEQRKREYEKVKARATRSADHATGHISGADWRTPPDPS